MIPKLIKGEGMSGALRYAMGEGVDPISGRERPRGAASRAQVIYARGLGVEFGEGADLEPWRKMAEFNAREDLQYSRSTKVRDDVMHATLNYDPKQPLPTNKEMREDVQSFLDAMGMPNALHAVVRHSDKRHPHAHVLASRVNPTDGKAYDNTDDRYRAVAWSLQHERRRNYIPENKQHLHRALDAVESRDPARIFEAITERNATFSRQDMEALLALDPELANNQIARRDLRNAILEEREAVMLEERPGEAIKYTTRAVLEEEMSILHMTRELNRNRGFSALDTDYRRELRGLSPEQARAVESAIDDRGLGIIKGQAGVGKSTVLGAIKRIYENNGFAVRGLSHTNTVVRDLEAAGFNAFTLDSEEKRFENRQYNRNTILTVDETAMLDTPRLKRLIEKAHESGAKVLMVGDDQQLAPIERGGMFTELAQEHGASELSEVRRVSDREQKRAFNHMHAREWSEALKIFDERGDIQWDREPENAENPGPTMLGQLIESYDAARIAHPNESSYAVVVSNEEVDVVNAEMRRRRQERGELQNEVELETASGKFPFSVGDQVAFGKSGLSQESRKAGIAAGAMGTLTGLEQRGDRWHATVSRRQRDGGEHTVSFDPVSEGGLKHAYAGTVYGSQGKTISRVFSMASPQLRDRNAYVGATRHAEEFKLFVPRGVATDIDQLAAVMSTPDDKTAAISDRHARVPPEIRREIEEKVRSVTARQAEKAAERAARKEAEPPREDWTRAARQADARNRGAVPAPERQSKVPSTPPGPDAPAPEPATTPPEAQPTPPRAEKPKPAAEPIAEPERPGALNAFRRAAEAENERRRAAAFNEQIDPAIMATPARRSPAPPPPDLPQLPSPEPQPERSWRRYVTHFQDIWNTLSTKLRRHQEPQESEQPSTPSQRPEPNEKPARERRPERASTSEHPIEQRAPKPEPTSEQPTPDLHQNGAPLGGRAHPQGPVERAAAREALREKPAPRAEPKPEREPRPEPKPELKPEPTPQMDFRDVGWSEPDREAGEGREA